MCPPLSFSDCESHIMPQPVETGSSSEEKKIKIKYLWFIRSSMVSSNYFYIIIVIYFNAIMYFNITNYNNPLYKNHSFKLYLVIWYLTHVNNFPTDLIKVGDRSQRLPEGFTLPLIPT